MLSKSAVKWTRRFVLMMNALLAIPFISSIVIGSVGLAQGAMRSSVDPFVGCQCGQRKRCRALGSDYRPRRGRRLLQLFAGRDHGLLLRPRCL